MTLVACCELSKHLLQAVVTQLYNAISHEAMAFIKETLGAMNEH